MTKLMQLDPTNYKNGLYTLVSDPSLVGSARRTKRLAIDSIPAMPRIWDITPIVNPPTIPDLEIIDTFQLNVGSQNALSIDPASPLITVGGQPIFKHGCAKTNINLAMLNDGDTWHVGLRAIVTGGYTLSNVVFYDTSADAAEYAASQLDQLTNSEHVPSNRLVVSANRSAVNLSIAGTVYNPVTQSYQQISGEFPMKYDVDTNGSDNTTALMLLHRDGNTLNVTIAAVDTAGNYDINEVHSVGNDNLPFDFSSLTMFLYLGTLPSPSMVYQSVAPTITTGLPDYDVAFTRYETVYSGTQSAFDALFPVEAHRPSGVSVQQAVFPEGVRVGELLNVRVDLQYTGAPPRPYGFPDLHHGQTIMVTANSSEGKSYDRMIRSNEFDPLLQTVNNLSNGGGVSLPHGEIVVYVNNNFDTDDLLTGNRAFGSIDEAFAYLSTLPPYMPKRMVIDDRPIGIGQPIYVEGTVGQHYGFGANNIRLSTYTAFSGEPYPQAYNQYSQHRPDGSANPLLYVRNIKADVIHLVDFWGTFDLNTDGSSHVYLGDSVITPTSPTSLRAANLRLGSNAVLYAVEGTIDYYDGGAILLEDNAFLKIFFGLFKGGGAETPLNIPFIIHKSAKARLYVSGYGNNYSTSLPLAGTPYQMSVYYPSGGLDVEFPPNNGAVPSIVNLMEINYNYAPVFTVDNVVMVRSLTDFKPDYDYSGNIVLPDTATTFFIVGTVNLGSHSLYGGSGDVKHHFMGFPDSKLVADTYILTSNSVNSSQSFKFSNLQLETLSVAPQQTVITMESGGLDITDCIIDAPAGVWYIANAVPLNAKIWPINVKSTEFKSNARTPGSIIRLNSHCNVAVRDVTYSGDVFPSQPVMDIRGLNVTAHVIVDGFTVIGNDESISSPLFIVDDLQRANGYISVKGVHVTHGNINAATPTFLGLFTKNYHGTNTGYYDAYNNVRDNRIVTDSTCGFVILKAPSIVAAVPNTSSDNVISLDETTIAQSYSKKYGFTNAISGMQNYTLNEHKLFEIRLKANVGAGANLTVRFKFKRIDKITDVEHESDYVEVVLNGSGTGTVDATFYRELISGGMYALVVQNVSAPINVAITNVIFTIREF